MRLTRPVRRRIIILVIVPVWIAIAAGLLMPRSETRVRAAYQATGNMIVQYDRQQFYSVGLVPWLLVELNERITPPAPIGIAAPRPVYDVSYRFIPAGIVELAALLTVLGVLGWWLVGRMSLVPLLKRFCDECGYDLRGASTTTCPECGTVQPLRGRLGARRPESVATEDPPCPPG